MPFYRRKANRTKKRPRKGILKKLVTKVNRLTSAQELKVYEAAISTGPLTVDTAGTLGVAVAPAVGDDQASRDGQKISVKSLQTKGYCYSSATVDYTSIFRVIFFVDRRTNYNNPPLVSTVLKPATVHGMINPEWKGRFRILLDRTYNLTPSVASAQVKRALNFNFNLKNLPMEFKEGGTSYTKNGIYYIVISDKSNCEYDHDLQLKFTDS